MTRVIAIRPEPGLSATLERGREAGLAISGWPLFHVAARDWDAPDPATIDGLLFGSANAVRLAGSGLQRFAGKPVYAVGDTTAQTAREAGFTVAVAGTGGLQELLRSLSGQALTLLRLAGLKHVPLVPPLGIVIETRIPYESAPLPMPPDMAGYLREGAVVLLHSAEAARHFAAECDRLGIERGRIALAALGPRIAAAAGGGWRQVRASESLREGPLLALAKDMCH